jgi:hypothetical protein
MKYTKYEWAISALALLIVTFLYGWCVNLYLLIQGAVAFEPTSNWAFLALRAIGVFVVPLGGALGLFF